MIRNVYYTVMLFITVLLLYHYFVSLPTETGEYVSCFHLRNKIRCINLSCYPMAHPLVCITPLSTQNAKRTFELRRAIY